MSDLYRLTLFAHGGGGRGGPAGPWPMPIVVAVAGFVGLIVLLWLVSILSAHFESRGKPSPRLNAIAFALTALLIAYVPVVIVLIGLVFLMVGMGMLPWPFIPLGLFVMGLGFFALRKLSRWATQRVVNFEVIDDELRFRTALSLRPFEYDRSELMSASRDAGVRLPAWVLRFRDGRTFVVDDAVLRGGELFADETERVE